MNPVQPSISNEDLLSVLESAFRAGLQEIKRIRAAHEPLEAIAKL